MLSMLLPVTWQSKASARILSVWSATRKLSLLFGPGSFTPRRSTTVLLNIGLFVPPMLSLGRSSIEKCQTFPWRNRQKSSANQEQ